MKAGCAPQRIGQAHRADEIADVFGHGGATDPAAAGLSGPEEPESPAGPGNHGVRLDDDERVPPARPQLGQAGPEEAVDRPEVWAFRTAMVKDRELLAEGEDLELESSAAPKRSSQGM